MEDGSKEDINNCSFQYGTDRGMVEDKSALTRREANKLWDKHMESFISNTNYELNPEMCIWENMSNTTDYHTKAKYLYGGECRVFEGQLYTLA